MRRGLSPERIAAAIEAAGWCHGCDCELEHTVWRVRERQPNGGCPWVSYCGNCAPASVDWAPAECCACCSRGVRQPRDTPQGDFTSCSPACYAAARTVRVRVLHGALICEGIGCAVEFEPRRADQRFHSKACALATWKFRHQPCPLCGTAWRPDHDDPEDFTLWTCDHGHTQASAYARLLTLGPNGSGPSHTNGRGPSRPLALQRR
jgi:hypothetical protein